MITEPDVTFTDYALMLECAVFAYLIYHRGNKDSLYRFWFTVFFISLSLASLVGGTVHGFFLDETTFGYQVLWPCSLIAIGLSAVAGWSIGAIILFVGNVRRAIFIASRIVFVLYCVFVLFVNQHFLIAILHFVPAALFFFFALLILYRRKRAPQIMIGAFGLALTFFAPVIQQGRIAIHPVYFNYNALYHAVQALAFFMIFWAARSLSNKKNEGFNL